MDTDQVTISKIHEHLAAHVVHLAAITVCSERSDCLYLVKVRHDMGTVQAQQCFPHRPVVHRAGSCRRIDTPAITEHAGGKITAAYGTPYNRIRTDHGRFTFDITIRCNLPTFTAFDTVNVYGTADSTVECDIAVRRVVYVLAQVHPVDIELLFVDLLQRAQGGENVFIAGGGRVVFLYDIRAEATTVTALVDVGIAFILDIVDPLLQFPEAGIGSSFANGVGGGVVRDIELLFVADHPRGAPRFEVAWVDQLHPLSGLKVYRLFRVQQSVAFIVAGSLV